MGNHLRILTLLCLWMLCSASPAEATDLEAKMQSALYETQSAVNNLQQKLGSGGAVSDADYARLNGLFKQIRENHLGLKDLFQNRRDEVISLGTKAPGRHRDMMDAYGRTLDEIVKTASRINKKEDITGPILDDLKSLLDKALPKKKKPVFGSLPYRSLGYQMLPPDKTSQVTPAFMGGNTSITADDLASLPEAPISAPIAELARSLHWNPVELYEYVKNNIKTEWYWGCMKGAEQTLSQQSGNDCDQAALLVALLRASKYPARYVRGEIEFFPDLSKAKNLTGVDKPTEMAAFFQKAGIPFEPVISGGRIANFRIEHIFVETLIPYANYRGAVIDEHGKHWVPVDASIKAAGYLQNTPINILDNISLNTFEQTFLAQVRSDTPLSYLSSTINQYLALHQPGKTYGDTLVIRQQVPEYLNEVPASPQFKVICVNAEYEKLPDNLIHQTQFTAKNSESILFDATFPAYQLSGRRIELTYEPETVEDQEIINSYGGLDNTPCYLVRLRPVLKVDGDSQAAGGDGLPMGADYALIIDLHAPNGTHQEINNTHIVGNLSVIGLVCQNVVQPEPVQAEERDAARLLYEEALNYIDRWNQAEDELAKFLQISVSKPIPTIVTLGGVIDVTYLLDTPHGFAWKGLYVDANLRASETGGGYVFSDLQLNAGKLFKQLSGLEGSALEGRLIDDDFGVTSISTSELFALAHQRGVTIHTIDGANEDAELSALPFSDDIKDRIGNAVNQGLVVQIPASEISYEDWTGIGYLLQNPDTGDSGWMLTGMIAGGMTVLSPDNPAWESIPELKSPNQEAVNTDPSSAAKIFKISATDLRKSIVGTLLPQPLQVKVLDSKGRAVKGAKVVFEVKKGGGQISILSEGRTDESGIASANFTLGLHTADNPVFLPKNQGDAFSTQEGLNIIDAYLELSGVHLKVPFSAYGLPDIPFRIIEKLGNERQGVASTPAGTLSVQLVDQFGNPVSNANVKFETEFPPQPVEPDYVLPFDKNGFRNLEFYNPQGCQKLLPAPGDCDTSVSMTSMSDSSGTSMVGAIYGNTVGTKYTVRINDQSGLSLTYHLYTLGYKTGDTVAMPLLELRCYNILNSENGEITAATAGDQTGHPFVAALFLLESPFHCDPDRNILISDGFTNSTKITSGTVTFTADNGGAMSATEIDPDGNYQSYLTTASTPGKYIITVSGQANVTVNALIGNRSVYRCDQFQTRTMAVKAGLEFYIPEANADPVYIQPISPEVLTGYGVSVEFTDAIDGKINMFADEDGYLLCDTALNFTITPVDYWAANCYVVILKDDQPIKYIMAESQGSGFASISRGFKFDPGAQYAAKIVLNTGSGDYEVESETVVFNFSNSGKINHITIKDIQRNVPILPGKQADAVARTTPEDLPVVWEKIKDEPSDKDKPIRAGIDAISGTIKVEKDSGSGWITIQAALKDAQCINKLSKVYVGCTKCENKDMSCSPLEGNGFVELSSINLRLSLGKGNGGAPAGDIFLQAEAPSPALAKSKSLEFYSLMEDVDARYDGNGLRQILAPRTFVNIRTLNDYAYEVGFYRPDVVSGEDQTNGLYAFTTSSPPFTSWRIENPDGSSNTFNRLKITQNTGSGEKAYEYVWDEAKHQWTLIKGNGLSIETRAQEQINDQTVYTHTIKDAQNRIAEKKKTVFQIFDWGNELVEAVNDPDGAALKTTMTYDNNGKIASEQYPDGSWMRCEYDNQGNKIAEIRPWLDCQLNSSEGSAHVIYYNYVSVDPDDSRLAEDKRRSRTVTETILGNTVSKTYYSFKVAANRLRIEISEQCTASGAGFGDPSNLRTIRTYYPSGTGAADSGGIKQIQHPDGRMDSYAYEYGAYDSGVNPGDGTFTAGAGRDVRETVVHATLENPAGIPGKTTKEVSISDAFGKQLLRETYVYTGSGYERVQWTEYHYDDFGRITEEISSNGSSQQKIWDCCHLASSTDAIGIPATYTYDALGRAASISRPGPSGNMVTSYMYDAAGRKLSQTVSASGLTQTTVNSYDTAGRMTKTIGPDGLETQYAYNNSGRMTTVNRSGGATEITERYPDGKVKRVYGTGVVERYYEYGVNGDGTQWTSGFTGGQGSAIWEKTTTDLLGRVIKTEKPGFGGAVAIAANTYNNNGQLVKTRATGQADQVYVYDELGNQIRSGLDVDGSGELEPVSMDRISQTDTRYIKINADWWQQIEQKAYARDNQANATSTGIQRNRLTGLGVAGLVAESASIDVFGNQTISKTTINRASHTETRTIDYPDSNVEAKSISVNGSLTSSTGKTGITMSYQYDALGRQIGVTDPRTGTSVTHYDTNGRVGYIQDPAGSRTTYTYDLQTGRKIAETNALGNTTRFAYNAQGQVVHTWGDAAYPVSYEYNPFGQMTAMRTYRTGADWNGDTFPDFEPGDTTTWAYDVIPSPLGEEGQGEGASGLLLAKADAAGNAISYTYDPAGRLSTRTWARMDNNNPIITTYSYDPATGDLTGIDYSDATPDIDFTNDRLGRQTSVTDATGNRTFNYTDYLQLSSESMTGIIDRTITRNYESSPVAGRNSGFAVGGYQVSYGYDEVGRLNSMDWIADAKSGSADYSYIHDSDLLASVSVNGALSTAYTYDPHRNVKTQVQNTYGGQVVSRYDYAYDAFGRRTSVANSGSAFTTDAHNAYQYNNRNELTASARYLGSNLTDTTQPVQLEYRAYQYDPIGNRTNITEAADAGNYTANSLNQYTQQAVPADGTRTFDYDEDGNLISLVENATEIVYTWNAENRLTSVAPRSPNNGDKKVEFIYDYIGRRVKKTVYDYSSGSWILASEFFYIYDGWNIVEEITKVGSTSTSRYFVWGLDLSQSLQGAGGIGGLLSTVNGAPTYLYCYDANGNVNQLVTAADGAIAAKYEYDPYGKTIRANGSHAVDNPFRFSTKYHDNETGLVYHQYRFYSPDLGRWINRDPINDKDIRGENAYAYVSNRPTFMIDILGLWGSDVHKDLTAKWAIAVGFKSSPADKIGEYDDAVDGGATSPYPAIGDQSYHFDTSHGGEDTRLVHFKEHMKNARDYCTWDDTLENDEPEKAVAELGKSLHPLQDIVAHGSFGKKVTAGDIWTWHNMYSPQWLYDPRFLFRGGPLGMMGLPDNINYDSTGAFGIPDDGAMHYILNMGVIVVDWATFKPGTQRLNHTKEVTSNALETYEIHLDDKASCKCKEYFLELGMITLD